MRSFRTKTFAAILAAVMAVAAFAGCAGGEEVKKTSSDTEKKASADAHTGEKKIEVYLDDQDNPYYYDSKGKKQMLIAVDYEDQMNDDVGEVELTNDAIYTHYDGNNGLSFDIPDGWFAEDMYDFGTPTVYKGSGSDDDVDFDYNIAIVPAQLTLNYDMDKDKKVDEKFIKNYFETFVKNGLYDDYKLKKIGESTLGGEKATVYDIVVTYKNETGDSDDPAEKTRTICYVTDQKNCYVAVLKVPLDDDAKTKEYTDAYEQISKTIKLPSEEQTKEMLKKFTADPSESFLEDEGGDLTDDDFNAEIKVGTDSEDVEISTDD